MQRIDKNTKIADILRSHPQAKDVLAEFGLNCSECSGAKHESLRQGAINHGLDPEELVARISTLFQDCD